MFQKIRFALLAMGWIAITGCSPSTSDNDVVMNEMPPELEHESGHASEGPHHGSLVELGNEEYHAELVHDERCVTIYVLDSSATNAVPIAATEITINVMRDGSPEQFKLTADPEDNEAEGKSSRFRSKDVELASHIDDESAAAKLVLNINGTSYRGDIVHEHEHGHDHAHD